MVRGTFVVWVFRHGVMMVLSFLFFLLPYLEFSGKTFGLFLPCTDMSAVKCLQLEML